MQAPHWLNRDLLAPVAALCICLAGISTPAMAIAPPNDKIFDTELLSLDLRGSGQLPILIGDRFVDIPVMIDIHPTAGKRHLGGLTATPTRTGDFQVDSFFDIFFDVTFSDLNGNPLIKLDGLQDRIAGRWIAPPDGKPQFPPTGGSYFGGQTLTRVPLGNSFFDITYRIALDFSAGPPDLLPDGLHYLADVTAQFSGQINPEFGPFALNGAAEIVQRPVPLPPAWYLFGAGLLGLMRLRQRI